MFQYNTAVFVAVLSYIAGLIDKHLSYNNVYLIKYDMSSG